MSGGFGFGLQNTTANTGTAFSFGPNPPTTTTGISFGTPTATGTTGGFQFSSPGQTTGGLSFGTPQTTTTASTGGFMFGGNQQSGGLTFGTPQATPATTSAFKTTATGLGTGQQQTPLSFGSTTPQMTTLGFGSAAPQTTALGFGSSTPQTTVPSFGTTPQATVPAFGSTLQTTTNAPTFSLPQQTKTTTAVAPLTFGSTPQTTLSFGSSAPLSFGLSSSMPQATAPSLVSAPQTKPTALSTGIPVTSTGLTFGTTQTTTSTTTTPQVNIFATPIQQQTTGLLFGTSIAATTSGTAATTTAAVAAKNVPDTKDDGSKATIFGRSTAPATTKPTISFGAVPAITTAVTTTATSIGAPSTGLFSFSTPKTTAATISTGFSTTTGGNLFSTSFTPVITATTSAAVTTATTTATPFTGGGTPFIGLGGVDTATSLTGIPGGTSGRSDIKSIKENAVPNEIMQTIDTFKNFVKQQKNLACEITRTSGKPMNKVTEDTDSLKQILTAVYSVLQKNRQMSNKLKADTTKCLLLCEMAQHTHDTPVGLQNENVAPLEFFLQLATKFEKDVANLRTEIDNTEKHVKSLSQPAVLTSQELSAALRRLHDSFVALAGQLQTAHAAVAIQKERHLNLRRHFLKDNTNIFEPDSKSSSYMKSFKMPVTLSPGPTPFSSMGNTQPMNVLATQDKSGPSFPAANTTLSGWGTTPAAPTGTSLLQTTGNTSLFSPQPVENQNFQLLKPPPGNKRGKR